MCGEKVSDVQLAPSVFIFTSVLKLICHFCKEMEPTLWTKWRSPFRVQKKYAAGTTCPSAENYVIMPLLA